MTTGLGRNRQIETFHWKGDAPLFQTGFEVMRGREHVERITALRRRIREADQSVSNRDVRDLWRQAVDDIQAVRLSGDLVVTAFFEGRKHLRGAQHKDRKLRRSAYAALVAGGEAEGRRDEIDDRRCAEVRRPAACAAALENRVPGGVRTGSVRRIAEGVHTGRELSWVRCAGGESAVPGRNATERPGWGGRCGRVGIAADRTQHHPCVQAVRRALAAGSWRPEPLAGNPLAALHRAAPAAAHHDASSGRGRVRHATDHPEGV